MWLAGASRSPATLAGYPTLTAGNNDGTGSQSNEASGSRPGQMMSQLSQADEVQPQKDRIEEVDASGPNVFRKLRQNSKQIFNPPSNNKRTGSIFVDDTLADLSYLRIGEGKLTFFDLPAEIRNTVYEDVGSSTRLYVSSAIPKKKEKESKNAPQTTPSLLLVSKQVRLEYVPLLLQCAQVSFAVRDFDFRNLMRVSSSLYSTELKALRKNTRLTVRLLATKPTKDSLAALRRWAQRRTEDLYSFPVHYALVWPKFTQLVPTSSSVRRIDTYIQRRNVLLHNIEAIDALGKEIPEALRWELQPLVEVYNREIEILGAMGSNLRAPDPFGDQWLPPMFGRRF